MRLRVCNVRLDALFGLGFPTAPDVSALNLATRCNSPAHSSIGTPSPHLKMTSSVAPAACGHTVSGLFHSPPGVLFTFPSRYLRYRSPMVFSLDRGRPGFSQNSACSGLLGMRTQAAAWFSPTGLSPSMAGFSNTIRLTMRFVTARSVCGRIRCAPTTPTVQRPQALTHDRFGLYPFRSPLLRASPSISSPPVTEMFHFTGYPPSRC